MCSAPFPYRTVSVLRPLLDRWDPTLDDGHDVSAGHRHFGFTRKVVAVSVTTLHASLPLHVFNCRNQNEAAG